MKSGQTETMDILHVHLITVEIGVVRRRHGQVQTEGYTTNQYLRYAWAIKELTGVRHELHPMAHHTHLVQTRLTVEEHVAEQQISVLSCRDHCEHSLSVLQMPLHDPSKLQERVRTLVVPQIYTFSRITNDVASTRVSCRPIPY